MEVHLPMEGMGSAGDGGMRGWNEHSRHGGRAVAHVHVHAMSWVSGKEGGHDESWWDGPGCAMMDDVDRL